MRSHYSLESILPPFRNSQLFTPLLFVIYFICTLVDSLETSFIELLNTIAEPSRGRHVLNCLCKSWYFTVFGFPY